MVYILVASPQREKNVSNIEIIGAESIKESKLKSILRTKERGLIARKEFDRRVLRLDAISIKSLYLSYGFLEVSVKDSFTVTENGVDVFLIINEGKQYYLKSVILRGNRIIDDKTVKSTLKLKIDKPYNPVAVNSNIPTLEEKYHQYGKLFALVQIGESISDSVEVVVQIAEGPTVYIANYFIEGLENLDSSIVIREIIFKRGELYQKDKIDLTQRRLMETGVFSLASITPLKVANSDTTVNMLIELRQFRSREWISEGGYFPDKYYEGVEEIPGIGGEVEWRHRSLFRSTTSFSTQLIGHIPIEQKPVYPKVRFDMSFANQWLLGYRVPTQIQLYYETFRHYGPEDSPTIHRYGLEFSNIYRLNDRSFIKSGLSWEMFIGPKSLLEERDREQRSFTIQTHLDKSDDPLYPKRGYVLTLDANRTGGILRGNIEFFKLDFGVSGYFPAQKNVIIAGRIKYGQIFGWELDQDIQYDLFYLGGSTSLRGWDMLKFETNQEGQPVGDIIRIMTNWEIRFPLFWVLGSEIFLDGGYITDSIKDISMENMKWDTGIGLTLSTPLGPIRLDYAFPVNEQDMWKLQLGVHYIF